MRFPGWKPGPGHTLLQSLGLGLLIAAFCAPDTPRTQWPQLLTEHGKPLNVTGSILEAMRGSADFLITGIPMTDDELRQVRETRGVNLIHFATAVTGAVPCYNVREIDRPLNFSAEVIGGIFLGHIKRWNDPALRALNPSASLPNSEILVIGHAGEDGSTYALTDFLSKESSEWRRTIGAVRVLPKSAATVRGRDDEDIARLVKRTPNSMSYVELWAARSHDVHYGRVRNLAGRYIDASTESMSAAAMSASPRMLADVRASITDTNGPNDYPVSVPTWIVMPEKIPDSEKKVLVLSFLDWVLTKGQSAPQQTSYGKIPPDVITRELGLIAQLR